MRKQYDDFTQLKLKDMSKSISDMTYKYINPDTKEPTKVPATHYEKILDQVTEKYMAIAIAKETVTFLAELSEDDIVVRDASGNGKASFGELLDKVREKKVK